MRLIQITLKLRLTLVLIQQKVIMKDPQKWQTFPLEQQLNPGTFPTLYVTHTSILRLFFDGHLFAKLNCHAQQNTC
jgi:hypothetical protein